MTELKRLALASIAAGCLTLSSSGVFAQSASRVVGTWQLVSNVVTIGAKKTDQYGPNPHGILYFETNGHYVLSIMRDDLPKFAGKGRMHGTDAENRAIVQGSISHFGTYEVEGSNIIFHVAYATFPNWDGTTSKRPFKISGDELSFFVPHASAGPGSSALTIWKRQQ